MKEVTFKSNGTAFHAITEAEAYLKGLGYRVGSMCLQDPIGFAPAEKYTYIAKWWNISTEEKKSLTGELNSTSFRTDDVIVRFY